MFPRVIVSSTSSMKTIRRTRLPVQPWEPIFHHFPRNRQQLQKPAEESQSSTFTSAPEPQEKTQKPWKQSRTHRGGDWDRRVTGMTEMLCFGHERHLCHIDLRRKENTVFEHTCCVRVA